jgi:hypothetical protein
MLTEFFREMGSLAPEEAAARGTASSVIADFGLNVMFFDFGNRDLPNEARYGSRHAARLRGHELGKVKGADISRYMKEGLELAKPVLKFRHGTPETTRCLPHSHSIQIFTRSGTSSSGMGIVWRCPNRVCRLIS